ncbi:adenosylcobinamide-GDP ribazoletransferase [Ancylobacter terrae]|uniref:adenosylcobinamide-GDP ribazoletransferase n=1 Tax=Ancylobacter sp. sgz301288 TaxID=3342077 RepID=UPI00385F6818
MLLPPPIRELPAALRFLTRIPLPVMRFETEPEAPPDIARLAPALPLAGAAIGAIGAASLLLALSAGLSAFVAATLAIGTLAFVTGAFHEDGLADTADALGGATPARRLEIMKDSRVGTFGVMALILATALRIGGLQGLAGAGAWHAAAALIAASGAARLGGLWILCALPPARSDGLGLTVGRPAMQQLRLPGLFCLFIAATLIGPTFGPLALAVAAGAGMMAAFAVQRLALNQFGGQTGDVAGAATLAVEIAFLLALLIFAPHSLTG